MGYADWDRVVRRGTEQISSATWTPGNSDFTLPIDVRPFEAVAFVPLAINGLSLTEIDWLATDNPDSYVSYENLVLDGNIVNQTAIIFPCLTSFMALRANVLLSASTGTLAVYGLVRSLPVRSVPTSYVHQIWNGNINANGEEIAYPADYMTGPARLLYYGGAAGGVLYLETFDSTLTGVVFYDSYTLPVGYSNIDVRLPMGAWRTHILNTTGAGMLQQLFATMSPTGT